MSFYEGGDIGEHCGRWTRETLFRGLGYGAAPSTLIEAVDEDGVLVCKGGEKIIIVAIAMVAEAVDEDHHGGGGCGRLEVGNWSGLLNLHTEGVGVCTIQLLV